MPRMTIEERAARVKEITESLQELDVLLTETPEDNELRSEWNSLNEERDMHVNVTKELEARKARLREFAKDEKSTERASVSAPAVHVQKSDSELHDVDALRREHGYGDRYEAALRDNARRAMDKATFAGVDSRHEAEARDRADRIMRSASGRDGAEYLERAVKTSSDTYTRAFAKSLMKGAHSLTAEESRTMSAGVSAEGGYAVPPQLDPTLILTDGGSASPLRQISRVETITGSKWQGLTSAGTTVTRSAEGTESADNSFTVAQPEATPTRAIANVEYSIEIEQDWMGFLGEVTKVLTKAKTNEENAAFVTGTGLTVFPEGVVTGATTVNDGAAMNLDMIKALHAALPYDFRQNATFMANLTTYNAVRTLAEASGIPSPYSDPSADRPAKLYGVDALESTAMAVHGTAGGGEKYLLVGDFSQFLIVDKLGMTVEIAPHIMGANGRWTGKRAIVAAWRNTSKVLVPSAFRVLVDNA